MKIIKYLSWRLSLIIFLLLLQEFHFKEAAISYLVSSRRIKQYPYPVEVIAAKSKELEDKFWKEMTSEFGGEARLGAVLSNFYPVRAIIDQDGIQKVEGFSGDLYKVVFIIFPDKKILLHIHNQEFEELGGFPEEIFLPLPEEYTPLVESKIQEVNPEETRFKFATLISGPFISPSGLEKYLANNSILRHLLSKIIQNGDIPGISSEVYYYSGTAMSGYLRVSNQGLIVKRLSISPSVYMLAHELIHHLCWGDSIALEKIEDFENNFPQKYPQLYQGIEENYSPSEIIEEELATLFGAFADTRQENEKILLFRGKEISFKIKTEDVELFADLGLIPEWMRPSRLGYTKDIIDEEYYQLIKKD